MRPLLHSGSQALRPHFSSLFRFIYLICVAVLFSADQAQRVIGALYNMIALRTEVWAHEVSADSDVRKEASKEASEASLGVWALFCDGWRAWIGRMLLLEPKMLTIKLPQLLNVHQVPRVFWEHGIMSGYRHPKSSALDCILSSFQLTNETVNIWTHFLPTWYFMWRLLVLSHSLDFTGAYNWPLLVYMLMICIYPFTSSCAHTFSSMSPRACHICYFFDYGALSLYSLGCAFTYGAYTMPDRWVNSTLHQYFVPVAAFNSFLCTGLSCYSRFLELECLPLSKNLRMAAFVYPFIFDNIPLFYRLLFCFGEDCNSNMAISSYICHLFCALLTVILFASHLPERLAPGRFDYFGHSHQLFHICAVVGTHFQMEAVLTDMTVRRPWLTANTPLPSTFGTLGIMIIAVLGNLLLIGGFTTFLRSPTADLMPQSNIHEETKEKEH